MTTTLTEQLKAIGLAPADVTFIAFSHFHLDHTGNANAFGASTWIINRNELSWATADPTPGGVNPESFSAYKDARTQMIDGDYDVFGDADTLASINRIETIVRNTRARFIVQHDPDRGSG